MLSMNLIEFSSWELGFKNSFVQNGFLLKLFKVFVGTKIAIYFHVGFKKRLTVKIMKINKICNIFLNWNFDDNTFLLTIFFFFCSVRWWHIKPITKKQIYLHRKSKLNCKSNSSSNLITTNIRSALLTWSMNSTSQKNLNYLDHKRAQQRQKRCLGPPCDGGGVTGAK